MANITFQTGGSGQRRLMLASPDESGYTGAGLVKSWGGKGCLYIIPIQHVLAGLYSASISLAFAPKNRYVRT